MPVQTTNAHIPVMKGARNVRKQVEHPNIVETYQFGNSVVNIADNYVRTDPAEVEAIKDDFHSAGYAIAKECYERGEVV